jgi:hypothetical protein
VFNLGQTLATPGALAALIETGISPSTLLARHVTGDWGDVCKEDACLNERGVKDGSRLLSAYVLPSGVRVWLVTEWDRSATTFLLPEEY